MRIPGFYRKSDEIKCHKSNQRCTEHICKLCRQILPEDVTVCRSRQRSKSFSTPSAYRSPACQSASFVSGMPSSHFCKSTTSAKFALPSALMSPEIAGGSSVIAVVLLGTVVAETEVAEVIFVVVTVAVVVVVVVVVAVVAVVVVVVSVVVVVKATAFHFWQALPFTVHCCTLAPLDFSAFATSTAA